MFGASVAAFDSHVVICGGISLDSRSLGQRISVVSKTGGQWTSQLHSPPTTAAISWPVMLGSSTIAQGGHLIVLGGGATCFPVGSFWAGGVHTIKIPVNSPGLHGIPNTVEYLESPKITSRTTGRDHINPEEDRALVPVTPIPRRRLMGTRDFEQILRERKPVVIEGLDFGACLTEWTPQHLAERVGPETQVRLIAVSHSIELTLTLMKCNR